MKKKDWNEAIQRYNIPVGGIEVRIPDYKPKPEVSIAPSNKPKPVLNTKQTKTVSTKPPPPPKQTLLYVANRALYVFIGLVAVGNVPVYSMVSEAPQTDLRKITEAQTQTDANNPTQTLNLPAIALESYSGYGSDNTLDTNITNNSKWQMLEIHEKDTLNSLLSKIGHSNIAQQLLQDADIQQHLGALQPNNRLFVQSKDKHLVQLVYASHAKSAYVVSATDNGYHGQWETDVIETQQARTAFSIKHSILQDGKANKLSNNTLKQLGAVFRKDMDFRKGTRVGDSFGVIHEAIAYRGETIYTGNVIAAEFNRRDNKIQRIRFTLENGNTDYFLPEDDAELKRTAFERKPVSIGRLSSGFGFRKHPVFGFLKAHAGVDFAAPYGTPIYATADGTVKSIGRQGGYGNVIELRHAGGISTLYGHMSSFNATLSNGKTVKRGDVIGYVGSTGTSTGNHVHYEYKINGDPQNPLTVELPKMGIMSENEMLNFKKQVASLRQEFIALRKDLASADSSNKGS